MRNGIKKYLKNATSDGLEFKTKNEVLDRELPQGLAETNAERIWS